MVYFVLGFYLFLGDTSLFLADSVIPDEITGQVLCMYVCVYVYMGVCKYVCTYVLQGIC